MFNTRENIWSTVVSFIVIVVVVVHDTYIYIYIYILNSHNSKYRYLLNSDIVIYIYICYLSDSNVCHIQILIRFIYLSCTDNSHIYNNQV